MRHLKGSKVLLAAGVLFLVPVFVHGAGFSLFEHGARAVAMGGAFGATADDPTAVYYNPAGLAFQDGTKVAAGFYLIKPISEFTGDSPYPGAGYKADQKDQLYYPPHVYATGAFSDRLHWGFSVTAPFGLGTWWEDDWAGKFVSKRIDLKVINFNPALSFKLTDQMAVAVGYDYFTVDMDITKSLGLVNPYTQQVSEVGQAHIYAKQQTGWGYNLAYLWKMDNGFSVGATYRSRVKLDADANGSFVQFSTGYADFDAIVANTIPFDENPAVTSSITFPAEMRLALAWTDGKLTLETDIMRIGWSSFDKLPIVFTDYSFLTQIRQEDYHDSMTYRAGVEYKTSDTWAWQAGGLYDETPVPTAAVSPLLPDANRWGISLGFSWGLSENMRLDAGYLHLVFDKRSTEGEDHDNFNGTYKNRAELLGFTLVYAF